MYQVYYKTYYTVQGGGTPNLHLTYTTYHGGCTYHTGAAGHLGGAAGGGRGARGGAAQRAGTLPSYHPCTREAALRSEEARYLVIIPAAMVRQSADQIVRVRESENRESEQLT